MQGWVLKQGFLLQTDPEKQQQDFHQVGSSLALSGHGRLTAIRDPVSRNHILPT